MCCDPKRYPGLDGEPTALLWPPRPGPFYSGAATVPIHPACARQDPAREPTMVALDFDEPPEWRRR